MDKNKVVCSPTDMKCWVEGSITVTGDCGHDVWVSPAMQEVAEREDVEVICLRCVTPSSKKFQLTMTPKQRDELNALLGTGEVDQLVTQLGMTMEDL